MNVRGVEIEVVQGSAASAAAGFVLAEGEAEKGLGDAGDVAVRSLCAQALSRARAGHAASAALPALGVESGRVSAVMAGKVMVQEAIRVARAGSAGLKRIELYCPAGESFKVFSKTVDGYLKHFLDVLLWGPFVTVDAIIQVEGGIVLVKRRNPPLGYALPGGFVDYGESLEAAVCREAMEETGLELRDLSQVHTYSDPARDPRFHTITTVFAARADGAPRAGDDAAEAHVVRPEDIEELAFAFDHKDVLRQWLSRGPGRASFQ
jgi:8-oxo-dGTP diphosphatase